MRRTQKENFVARAIVVLFLLILMSKDNSVVKINAAKRLVATATSIRQVRNVMANQNVMNFVKSKLSSMASLALTKRDVFLPVETAFYQLMKLARQNTLTETPFLLVTTAKELQKDGSATVITLTVLIPTATNAETISLTEARNAMTETLMMKTDVMRIAKLKQDGFAQASN